MNAASKFRKESNRRFEGLSQGSRRRYPADLRQLALEHLAATQSRGGTISDAARDLGVDQNSLRTWRKALTPDSIGRAMPMQVVADIDAPRFVVFGPSDVRIECRDAHSVAELVRALR